MHKQLHCMGLCVLLAMLLTLTTSGLPLCLVLAGKQADTAVIVVQTEPQAGQSSAAARMSSGQVSGSISGTSSSGTSTYFLRMLAGSRSNSRRSRSHHSTDSAEPDECNSSAIEYEDPGSCASLAHGAPHADAGSADIGSVPDEAATTAVVETADGAVQEASGDERSAATEDADWLASIQQQLQDTEGAAVALASAAGTAVPSNPSEPANQFEEAAARQHVPALSAAAAAYQQQLRMLEELELLEQQVQCTT
jgi:hypothetical protein